MQREIKNENLPYWIAVALIVLLGIFSMVTYKERMLFVDPAWVVYNIINSKSFLFAEHRYGAFITQIFPLIGSYLGLSLKTILLFYSISFYLFYLSAALIIGSYFKQKWLSILLALYLTLFVSDVYYWPNNEVHQGITWMFLFLGFYLHEGKRKTNFNFIIATLLAILAICSHLLVAIPFLFLWIYLHSNQEFKTLLKNKCFLFFTILILVLIGIRYQLSDAGWYDPVKLQGVKEISFNGILQAFQSGQAKSFSSLLFSNYWLSILVLGFSCGLLISSKKHLKLIALLLFTVGYFVLISITFPDAFDRSLRFYMESEWVALSIIISTPLAIWSMKNRKASVMLLIIFGIRLGYIFNSYDYFHQRYKNLEAVTHTLQQSDINKAVILEDQKKSEELFIMDWGLPIESLLLSKMEEHDIQTTFKIVREPILIPQNTDSFHAAFKLQSIESLNDKYFILDSTKNYEVIKGVDNLLGI